MPQDDRTEMWARQIYGLLMISDQQEKTYWSAWGEYEKNNSILIIGNKEVYMSSKKTLTKSTAFEPLYELS